MNLLLIALIGGIVLAIPSLIFLALYLIARKKHKPVPLKYNVGKVTATIHFVNGDKRKEVFTGYLQKRVSATVNFVYTYYQIVTADTLFLNWMKENNLLGFILADNNTYTSLDSVDIISFDKEDLIVTRTATPES